MQTYIFNEFSNFQKEQFTANFWLSYLCFQTATDKLEKLACWLLILAMTQTAVYGKNIMQLHYR